MAVEDFRRNIIRSSNSRVGHGTTGLSPGVDLSTVGYREVNRIIKVTRVAVPILGSRVLEKILVISVIVGLFASGRETKIGKLDVTTTVKQDVVGFDVTVRLSVSILNKLRIRSLGHLPVKEAKLVHSLYCHHNFGHVEAGDILGEDLVFDQHGHQITTRQELHQQVKIRSVLERSV